MGRSVMRRDCVSWHRAPPRLDQPVDVGLGRGPAQADADGEFGEAGRRAHRVKNMRPFDLARGTGRAGADHNSGKIERHHLGRGGDAGIEIQIVLGRRGTFSGMDISIGRGREETSLGFVSQCLDACHVAGGTRCHAEADNAGQVLGAGATAALLAAASLRGACR